MSDESFKRKLTAILSADVEGYSCLMGVDEDATIRTLTSYRELMSTLIQKHRGRVVDSPGDNLLAEFGSVVDAVRCAVEVQEELRVRNAELPENRRMQFRIGINLGDVVEEEGRIYGDGVNITARVEGLADGGGICISGTVYDSIKNKLSLSYESLGEHTVKNIMEPVRVYRVRIVPEATAPVVKEKKAMLRKWHWAALAVVVILIVGALAIRHFYFRPPAIEHASKEEMASPLSDKISIAVLPFVNMSGDPGQEYLCDGITEAIITALSKTPKLFVIARNSTFTYKGRAVSVRQVCKDLGVRYVLEGSIQKSGDQVRITAQLIDGKAEAHLWADKYDRNLKDIFDLQDQITGNVITALKVKLTDGEYARIYKRGTNNLEAYLKCMKGVDHALRFNKNDNEIARQLYEEAISIDPNYTGAITLLAWTYRHEAWYGWTKTPSESYKKAVELAKKALSLDKTNALPHTVLSIVSAETGDFETANSEAKKALSLEPNNVDSNCMAAVIYFYQGRYEEAAERWDKALQLSPISRWYHSIASYNYFSAGNYQKAIATAKEAIKQEQQWIMPAYFALVASYSSLGRQEEARTAAAEFRKIDPKFSLAEWKKRALARGTLPYLSANTKYRATIDRLEEALRKGGLE